MLFDLIVLGCDAVGVQAAILARDAGQRVALIEDPVHFAPRHDESWEMDIDGILYFSGSVRFATGDSLEIRTGGHTLSLTGRRFLLACGTRPKRPAHFQFDDLRVFDSDEALRSREIPQPVLVVGLGEHGLLCAAELIEHNLAVSVVDQRPPGSTPQWPRHLQKVWRKLQSANCPIQWGTTVLGLENRGPAVTVFYANGSFESFASVVMAVGRVGCTEHLRLPKSELLLDETLRVWCDDTGRTAFSHIYAAGSVVGFSRFRGTPRQEAQQILDHLLEAEIPARPAFLRKTRLAMLS